MRKKIRASGWRALASKNCVITGEALAASGKAVSEAGDEAVGYVSGALLKGDGRGADAEVFTLYVVRAAQGVGVGRALLKASARVLRAEGAKSLMIFVLSRNERA